MREPAIPQFDAETYLLWESRQAGRFELHHGFAVAVAGATLAHDRIAFNLRNGLERVDSSPPRRTFGSTVKVRVADDVFYYPDVSVTDDEIAGGDTLLTAPVLVAEVLSPRTRAYALIDKRAAYRRIESLRVIIFAHADVRRVDVDLRGPGRVWYTAPFDDQYLSLGDTTLSLDEIYARTSVE